MKKTEMQSNHLSYQTDKINYKEKSSQINSNSFVSCHVNNDLDIIKILCNLYMPISILLNECIIDQILTKLKNILENKIIIIDFSKISSYEDFYNNIKLTNPQIVYIFINAEKINHIYELEQIRQTLLSILDNDKFLYKNTSIDLSKNGKIFIFNKSEVIEHFFGQDFIYRKTFIIKL